MAAVSDLINDSLKEIGVLGASEVADGQSAADAFTRLNRFVSRLQTEGLSMYEVTRTTWTITASDAVYTVGASADVNVARPTSAAAIDHINFVDTSFDPDYEFPMYPLTVAEYAAIPQKAITSPYPQRWYYNPTYASGTLTLWPVPTSTTLTGAMYAATAVAQFSALSSTISLPPGWEEMLMTNLALLLCPTYGREPHAVLVRAAAESLATVKRANIRLTDMTFPVEFRNQRGRYDINSDTFI